MWKVQIVVFAGLLVICMPAFSYIDPGSGSAIVSLIIGAFVATGIVVKTYWYKLKALFRRKTGVSGKPTPKAKQSEED